MQIREWQRLDSSERSQCLKRPTLSSQAELPEQTKTILNAVECQGDVALFDLTARFDKVNLASLAVPAQSLRKALDQLSSQTRAALELAAGQIEAFHKQQLPRRLEVQCGPGIRCYREHRPIARVGFYIPGGSAPLPSTVLMLGIPARIVGNPTRILCSPPRADGEIHPVILAAAAFTGIEQVYRVGGAQAIAAMAFGTESIPKVDKIFGPGNAWVTEAKLQVAGHPCGAAIDLPAGPSEVMVIADHHANPLFIAADLLSQAEHGSDSQVMLVCTDRLIAERSLAELERLLQELPRRSLARQALQHSSCILTEDLTTALAIANTYAAEHLILQVDEAEKWAAQVESAGSVFLGPWSPESAGDYASGTNHVLPTYGHARAYSGLAVEAFMKQISFQELSREGLARIAPAIEHLAEIEGLDAHRLAVSLRLQKESK